MKHPFIARIATLLFSSSIAYTSLAEIPSILEPGKRLSLFAEDPDIVTPVGMAIDGSDRIYVIESHTQSANGLLRAKKGSHQVHSLLAKPKLETGVTN